MQTAGTVIACGLLLAAVKCELWDPVPNKLESNAAIEEPEEKVLFCFLHNSDFHQKRLKLWTGDWFVVGLQQPQISEDNQKIN